jgi:hypothetical protein
VPDAWLSESTAHSSSYATVIKALSAGQNMHIAEEYARTVGRQPPTIVYPPIPPYAPPGEGDHYEHLVLPDIGSPDEGSIADIEYRSMLGKQSDGSEKSPIVEKAKVRQKAEFVRKSESDILSIDGPKQEVSNQAVPTTPSGHVS